MDNQLVLRFLAEPGDVNFGGKVHGGVVMKWIDQAGYACATSWSRSYCVTVYVGGIQFHKPILIGNLVEVQARIIYTGRSSMHIAVDVFARDTRKDEYNQTTHCIVIFVAVDEEGKSMEVPSWLPETAEDRELETYAKHLVELRKEITSEMNARRLGKDE